MSDLIRYYKTPGLSPNNILTIKSKIQNAYPNISINLESELCYNIEISDVLSSSETEYIKWLITDYFQEDCVSSTSFLKPEGKSKFVLEFGPRLNFATAFSTNAVSICRNIGIKSVQRIEISRRFCFSLSDAIDQVTLSDFKESISKLLYDRMTEMPYQEELKSFSVDIKPENFYDIDVMSHGKAALEDANTTLGLAFDDWDIEYYMDLFSKKLGRNPTNVECFDLAQSNSEHSRHWFFKGKMIINGKEMEKCLMDLVCDTQNNTNSNNVIKFSDNSSAIKGFQTKTLIPSDVTTFCSYEKKDVNRHITLTAETHNFPTGVAPFPGAGTGTGGRIRDGHAAGKGSHVIAGTAGYCFGNLHIPGYDLPWELKSEYPSNFALPLEIAIEASNGASDYGNKFGEPVITGFSRSFGMVLADGERREWIKPIMFSGGIGSIEDDHILKMKPERGMKVAKIGGPVYRIGVGGGAASSVNVQGDNAAELDFGAVQRGDPEMEQKLNRLIRACVELGPKNPICSIHDQGAGGNGNVLKEICEPAGAVIHADKFELGDPTLSLMEIWGAEYQESDAILVHEKDASLVEKIAQREKVDVSFVGDITDDGIIKFGKKSSDGVEKHAVDLPLDIVLGKMPPKVYNLERTEPNLTSLELPNNLSIEDSLERVLRLHAVASKQYLTNKVDRSVTGLVAQQQCVGPLHLPLADVAVVALSHFNTVGGATAIGEQPIKMLVDPVKGARLAVAEAFTNLVFANITNIKDVKCSGNWMWAAKLKGEGAKLYDACTAMCDMLSSVGAAVDGGKDSLSMAARVDGTVVKSPSSLVISLYAPCVDIRKTIDPHLKKAGNRLIYVKMNHHSEWRLGGSALAQVFSQLGDNVPDINDTEMFSKCFTTAQDLLSRGILLSGHDVSDGGLVTCLLEMAFAGNLGFNIDIGSLLHNAHATDILSVLFAEEPALVFEVEEQNAAVVTSAFAEQGALCVNLGRVVDGFDVVFNASQNVVFKGDMKKLRSTWQETSYQLERFQCNPECVKEEQEGFDSRHRPNFKLSFEPSSPKGDDEHSVKVAVVREEGSNGDREMASSLHMVGFDVFDVTMHDLCSGDVDLNEFNGIVFVGGFSYADVFGSAKGWASLSKFNPTAREKLNEFRNRKDTFSLGVCNGCQLMSLLGWVGDTQQIGDSQPVAGVHLARNKSERFESRFVNVKILNSPSIMLQGMEESTLGIWVAHGEGRVQCKNEAVLDSIIEESLAPIRYVDDNGNQTLQYPLNPNASPHGIAGLCSSDGRHLAMMPHPERCTEMWQWPWAPSEWQSKPSPWLKMFENAYDWCKKFSC